MIGTSSKTFSKTKKILEKLKKVNNQSIYTNKLLQTCKFRGRLVTSIDELNDILGGRGDLTEKIVCTEFWYYRDTHKTEVIYNGDLFKLNKISQEDRMVNLGILLGNNNPDQNTTLPTNRDALTIIQGNSSTNDEGDDMAEFELTKIYVTLWLKDELPVWYLQKMMIRSWASKKSSNLKRKNPMSARQGSDIMAENIFESNIEGDLDVSKKDFLLLPWEITNKMEILLKECKNLIY